MSVIVHKPRHALLRYFTELRSIYHNQVNLYIYMYIERERPVNGTDSVHRLINEERNI